MTTTRTRGPIGLGLCILLLAAPGCMVTKSEVQTLQSQVYTQGRRIDEMRDKLDEMDSQLAALSEVRTSQANMHAEIEELKSRLAAIQGDVQTITHHGGPRDTQASIAQLREEVDAIRLALTTQLALDIEGLDAPAAPKAAPNGTAPAEPQKPLDTSPEAQAKTLYDKALDQFKSREYARAQSLWAEFVTAYPKHSLVANALFWQGEAFYQMQDYSRAVLAYEEVIAKHSKSSKYPAALLKQGMSFYRLGNQKAGKLVLDDLIKQFPNSAEARRAKGIIEENR